MTCAVERGCPVRAWVSWPTDVWICKWQADNLSTGVDARLSITNSELTLSREMFEACAQYVTVHPATAQAATGVGVHSIHGIDGLRMVEREQRA